MVQITPTEEQNFDGLVAAAWADVYQGISAIEAQELDEDQPEQASYRLSLKPELIRHKLYAVKGLFPTIYLRAEPYKRFWSELCAKGYRPKIEVCFSTCHYTGVITKWEAWIVVNVHVKKEI